MRVNGYANKISTWHKVRPVTKRLKCVVYEGDYVALLAVVIPLQSPFRQHWLSRTRGHLPDAPIRLAPILTGDFENLLTEKSSWSGGSQRDTIEDVSRNTDSLRGAMIGTTWGLLLNSYAMRLRILLDRSILTGFDCH